MQTVSEIDEQKGFEQLLRGIYVGIRNPRVHEDWGDPKEVCDPITVFLDYLLGRVRSTQSFFDLEEYKKKVFDPLFPKKREYAQLLVSEIPKEELVSVGATILRDRQHGQPSKLRFFFDALVRMMEPGKQERLMAVFSAELKGKNEDSEIVSVVKLMKPSLWPLLAEDVKLRTETRIIESVKSGRYNLYSGITVGGVIGVFASRFGPYFKLRDELAEALIGLLAGDWYTQNYVGTYFMYSLQSIVTKDGLINQCCKNLCYATLANDAKAVKTALEVNISSFSKKWKELVLEHALQYKEDDEAYYDRLKNKVQSSTSS